MFSSLLVGLSVSNIMGKRMKGFLWNFQARSSKILGTIWKKLGVLCLTPSIEERRYIEVYSSMIQFFISFFSRKSVLVSNITGKRMNGFSWNFQERLHIRQIKNLEHFWVVVINPLNSGSIFLFCKSVIVSTIKEKLMNGFSLIFSWYIGHDTKK